MASIDEIRGLGIREARKLRQAGVRTTQALMKRAATRSGRRKLAQETGLDQSDLLSWVNSSDLMRVRGIGGDYALLLHQCGVDTVKELRRRSPAALYRKMTQVNAEKVLVRRLPAPIVVARWVEEAAELEPLTRG